MPVVHVRAIESHVRDPVTGVRHPRWHDEVSAGDERGSQRTNVQVRLTYRLLSILTVMAFVLVSTAACDEDDDASDVVDDARTEVTEFVTPDGGADETPGAGGGQQTPAGDGEALAIAAENAEEFTKDELEAAASPFTVLFDNDDAGVVHNFAVYESEDNLDEPLGATDLETGPVTQELTLDLEPGEYYFRCDSHPNMEGTLRVE
jgi:plastocyanin